MPEVAVPTEPQEALLIAYLFPGFGDGVLLAPVLASLTRSYRNLRVGVLARARVIRALSVFALPVDIHVFPETLVEQEFTNLDRPVGPPRNLPAALVESATHELVRGLRKAHYDVGVDVTMKSGVEARRLLQMSGMTTLLGWLGAHETPESVGLDRGTLDVRSKACHHWCTYTSMPLRGRYLFTVCADDVAFDPATKPPPRLDGHRGLVTIVPGASSPGRTWPAERFVEVARRMAAKWQVDFRVVGSARERPLLQYVERGIRDHARVRTVVDEVEMTEAIRGSDLVVTNDTGPMHLAFLARVPTVALFRHMSHVVWGPLSSAAPAHVLRGDEGHEVSVDDVVYGAARLLARSGSGYEER